MKRFVCLGVLFCACLAGISADPTSPRSAENEVTWSDDFTGPNLNNYESIGALKLTKAGVVLGPEETFLAREARMGFDAECRMEVRLTKGKTRGLSITMGQRWQGTVSTRIQVADGKPSLLMSLPPEKPYLLPVPKDGALDGPWIVLVHARYGVFEAKAWRKSDPEPAKWQIRRMMIDTGWEPRFILVHTNDDEEVVLQSLSVRGTRPATKQFFDPLVKLFTQPSKTLVAMSQMSLLQGEGKKDEALQKARDAVKIASKEFGPDDALTGTCWNNLGIMLNDLEENKEALDAFKKAHAIRTKVLPAGHPHIGTTLNNLGTGYLGLQQYDEAEKWYRDALAFRKKYLGDHPDTGFTWAALGNALMWKLKFTEGIDCTREALKIYRAVLGDAHPDTLKMRSVLAYRLLTAGEYPAAYTHYKAVLETTRELYGPNHPATAEAELDLGSILKALGQYAEAREHLEKALDLFAKAGNLLKRADALNQLAITYADTGDDFTARTLLEEAIAIREKRHGAEHPEVIALRINLATVLFSSGERERAFDIMRKAVELLEKKLPADDLRLGLAFSLLTMFALGATDEDLRAILNYAERALKIKQRILGEVHPSTLYDLNNIAGLKVLMGQLAEAEKLLTDTLAICVKKLGENHPLTCAVRHNLGWVLYLSAKYTDAEAQMKQAASGFAKIYGPQHPDTARARNFLALSLAAQGKRDESLAAAADAAAGFGFFARKLVAGLPESQHAQITERWRPEVRIFFSLAAEAPDKCGGHGAAIFRTAMDWKATSGRAMLDRLEAFVVGQVPDAIGKYRKLRDQRQELMQKLMRGAGADDVEGYNNGLEEMRKEIDDLERQLASQVRGYAAIKQAREAGPAEVAERIPANGVLIEFVLLDEIKARNPAFYKHISTAASYLALVVIPKPGGGEPDVKLIQLGPAKDVDEAIQKWRTQAQKKKRDPVIEDQLREKVWDPLAKAIPANTKRLFIAPAGQLALIPFEAIWHDDAFLVEKYLISYCSTGRDLIPRPLPTGQPGPSVLVADPDFDHLPADAPVIKGFRPGGVSALAYASNPPQEDRLDGFTTEADAVEKLLTEKFPGQTKSRRRLEATEENVQKVVRPRVLYFITHGNFLKDQKSLITLEGRMTAPSSTPAQGETPLLGNLSGEDPRLRSYLCLTGFNRWKERAQRGLSDGMLTAREVESLDLWGTELVVTAACKTGVGDVEVGEGVMGLRRAFQQAGARTVVTSLWSVSDEKSAIMLPHFLQLYLDGTPKAEALRKAQLEMIASLRAAQPEREKKYQAAPFAWAAFICHGLPE